MRWRVAAGFLLLLASLPLYAQTCVPDMTPDWMASTASTAQVRPADCAGVVQSPPDLSWPDLSPDATYQVTLTYPGGATRSRPAAHNWINWDEVLPAGTYSWQVQVSNASGTQQSRLRRFTVLGDAVPFLVPDWNVLFAGAAAKPRPRALPDAATAQAMVDQRQAELNALLAQVDSRLGDVLPLDPAGGAQAAVAALASEECKRALAAALAWLVSLREEHYAEALRRALNLASWNPQGATSYANADEASRAIATTLALAYDWLHARLDAGQKDLLRTAMLARATDMYNDVIGSRARVAVHPYDSHGNVTLTHLAAICVLLAGDLPEAQICFRDTLPLAIHWTSPWGGEDGGFANGTAYAHWSVGDSLMPWYLLRWVLGVDLAQKAWVRNFANFIAYFLPPGTPSGAFGDAAEQQLGENWARFAKAHALFAPGALGRWYAAQLAGEDPLQLELLLAPPALPGPAPFPAGTPAAAFFPSIGWTALHSSLEDSARVSIYFKSSPYGSYNHSHADQNSFVINAAGQRLAIDSGYYDAYASPHWSSWYKQTLAHNAITYDGGTGQGVFEHGGGLAPGAITAFEHQNGHDIVTGDATQAYGGALTLARRSLVYLRPNLLLVYDRLASATARQWEWNIHALNAMDVYSDRSIALNSGNQRLCVDMLAGPPMSFVQTHQFTQNPGGVAPAQWHGRFYSDPAAGAEFIALLNVGCSTAQASASKSDGVWTVAVGGTSVTLGENGNIAVAP
jgi:hypothetical protein